MMGQAAPKEAFSDNPPAMYCHPGSSLPNVWDCGLLVQGADLRERNIRCWIMSQSPEAYPLKLGRWLTISKMTDKAVKGARARMAPSQKLSIRKRTVREAPCFLGVESRIEYRGRWHKHAPAFFGQPDLLTFPELEQTSALAYAVQLCRPDCVKALLDCNIHPKLIGLRDLWGHTALEYAMAMLVSGHGKILNTGILFAFNHTNLGQELVTGAEDTCPSRLPQLAYKSMNCHPLLRIFQSPHLCAHGSNFLVVDKANVLLQQMVDLILIRQPVLGKVYNHENEKAKKNKKQNEYEEGEDEGDAEGIRTKKRKTVPEKSFPGLAKFEATNVFYAHGPLHAGLLDVCPRHPMLLSRPLGKAGWLDRGCV
eukprot:1159952-Pelagomonas_calceolata.AAC.1